MLSLVTRHTFTHVTPRMYFCMRAYVCHHIYQGYSHLHSCILSNHDACYNKILVWDYLKQIQNIVCITCICISWFQFTLLFLRCSCVVGWSSHNLGDPQRGLRHTIILWCSTYHLQGLHACKGINWSSIVCRRLSRHTFTHVTPYVLLHAGICVPPYISRLDSHLHSCIVCNHDACI